MSGNGNQLLSDLPPVPETLPPDSQCEMEKLLYQTQLRIVADRQQVFTEHERAMIAEQDKALNAYIFACEQSVYNAYLEVTKGTIDRAQARAVFVEKAAGTIGAAYGVVLGLSFSLDKGHPLPVRGLVPTVFLGLSIVLVAVYLAFITHSERSVSVEPQPLPELQRIENLKAFIKWTSDITLNRSRWLQSAVISLGFGVLFLPIGFLELSDSIVWFAAALCMGITLLPSIVPRLTKFVAMMRQRRPHPVPGDVAPER